MLSTIDPVVLILGTAAITTLIWAGLYEWLRAAQIVDDGIEELRSQPRVPAQRQSLEDYFDQSVIRE